MGRFAEVAKVEEEQIKQCKFQRQNKGPSIQDGSVDRMGWQ